MKYSFFHSLHLKVIIGYGFLVGLLIVIGFVMRYETDKLIAVRTGELQREESRKLINRISGKLMDITIPGELLPLWERMDFQQYHDNNQCVIANLNQLRTFYPDHSQCVRIDSVCYLLEEKETQIGKLYELLNLKDNGTKYWKPITVSYADSLKRKNEELNDRLDRIIHDFEREATKQSETEQEERYHIRQSSFHILSFAMVVAFLFAILFYILIHLDIRKKASYRRKIEIANQKSQQLLLLRRRMILSILHDLRSPLGIVNGYAELAKEETDKEKRNMQIDSILTSSERMLSLTENLLEYYKLDAGGELPSLIAFQPDSFIQVVESDFRPLVESKGLAFHIDYISYNITLKGDEERLYRIVSNLLSNAIKFTATGSVTLSMRYDHGNLLLQVKDTGHGMTAEETTRVFNAFERLGHDGEVAGFGLGLSIASGLVSLLKGTIQVESKPGSGSVFTVSLPMPRTNPVRERSTIIRNHSLSYPMRILIIDDDPMQQMLMREMLHRQNITCDCCTCADEVMKRLQNEQYDLLITDIQMPETDGFTLLKMLRGSDISQAKAISVLAMTARVDLNECDYIEKGFAGCLFKPVTLSTLITTITGQDCLLANGEDVSFSLVLHEEKNPPEMLKLFIRETRKSMTLLRDAIEQEDTEKLSFILHKIAPLWETLDVHIPYHPEPKDYPTIFRQGEWLVRRATQLYHSLTNHTTDHEKDTDY